MFSLAFVYFRLTEIYFLQHLSANAYSWVNMKFLPMIAVRKNEIFFVALLLKQAIFHYRLSQLFVDDI